MDEFPTNWVRAAFGSDANPSFSDFVRRIDPGLLPRYEGAGTPAVSLPSATTILALRYDGGVVMAGDRRATEGMHIADRRIEKVFPADRFSAVAIAGVAGPAADLVKLFQTELEHYEKVEGENLSLDGKANRLAQLIKMNFPLALQGLIVVPLFAGYDLRRDQGRIYRFDAIGGRYEEIEFHATGSGGAYASGTLKKRWRPDIGREEAVRAAVESLVDAAEEDAATGGPDLLRDIYPILALVTRDGYAPVPEAEVKAVAEALLQQRHERGSAAS